jgi:hypothetical protein
MPPDSGRSTGYGLRVEFSSDDLRFDASEIVDKFKTDLRRIELEPEQEKMLLDLLKAGETVDRRERRWMLLRSFQGDELIGPGDWESINGDDFKILQRAGYLFNSGGQFWNLTPKALKFYEDYRADDPVKRTEETMRSLIDASHFQESYPTAYATWTEAERLLFDVNAERHLTVIGHKARETTQQFATRLIELHRPVQFEADPTKVEKRVGAVIAMYRETLSESRRVALEALGSLWRANNGLIQRQEHAGTKEGEPVTRDDARRLVLLTLMLMVELDHALSAPPPA